MTEQELRCLTSKNNEVYAVYDGKIVRPEAIRHLKNHATVHVVDKLTGGEESTEVESDSPKWVQFIRS